MAETSQQLTHSQMIANINAMEKQGAKPQEIQGYLDSLKAKSYNPTPFSSGAVSFGQGQQTKQDNNSFSQPPGSEAIGNFGASLFGLNSAKNLGESAGGALQQVGNIGGAQDIANARAQDTDTQNKLTQAIHKAKAEGKDTSKFTGLLKSFQPVQSDTELNPALNKTSEQVAGEGLGVASGVLGAGGLSKASPIVEKAPGILSGMWQGAKSGAAYGGAFGAVQGASDSMQQNKDWKGVAEQSGAQGLIGAAGGGLLGGVAGGVGGAVNRKLPDVVSSNRAQELQKVVSANSKLRDFADYASSKKGMDVVKILSEEDWLHGAVDSEGVIHTNNALKELNDILQPAEDSVANNIAKEGRTMPLDDVKKQLISEINGSGLKASAKSNALSRVESDIKGLMLDADKQGNIPIAELHAAKIDKTSNLDYMNPESKKIDKALARAYKGLVEANTTSIDVQNINKELGKFETLKDFLEELDGKRAQGGRLGKYFAQTLGGMIGSHFGPLQGLVASKVAGKIQGSVMGSTFGPKIGASKLGRSGMLEDAISKGTQVMKGDTPFIRRK